MAPFFSSDAVQRWADGTSTLSMSPEANSEEADFG
jgi:hypothetical protein